MIDAAMSSEQKKIAPLPICGFARNKTGYNLSPFWLNLLMIAVYELSADQ
jgi:hypothetical protein